MKYTNILLFAAAHTWAVRPSVAEPILAILASRASDASHSTQAQEQATLPPAAPSVTGMPQALPGGVALVPLVGIIMSRASWLDAECGMTSPQVFARQVRDAAARSDVQTIVLYVDTPGGTVGGVHEAALAIRAAKSAGKRVIACVSGEACSGGYWIASQADEIVLGESDIVGSIGAYMSRRDISRALAAAGISYTTYKTGEEKALGLEYEPPTETERDAITALLESQVRVFYAAVAEGRGIKGGAEAVREAHGSAHLYVGAEAVSAGLADRIGTLDDVLSELQAEAPSGTPGIPSQTAQPPTFMQNEAAPTPETTIQASAVLASSSDSVTAETSAQEQAASEQAVATQEGKAPGPGEAPARDASDSEAASESRTTSAGSSSGMDPQAARSLAEQYVRARSITPAQATALETALVADEAAGRAVLAAFSKPSGTAAPSANIAAASASAEKDEEGPVTKFLARRGQRA
ncbi:MAG: S49 family peptidase [Bacteroidetes bacterium]|nr:S49 family peptidase [Bacteroidota bacterium]